MQTQTNIFYSSIRINVGSIHEKTGERGLAHFFEHMIFKGTKNATSEDILLTLDSIGANYNASTSYEETNYYIAGKTADYEIILKTLLDLFLNPAFPDQDIKKEINVVLEEFRMNQDNPNKLTMFKLMNTIYSCTDERYANPVIGFEEDIGNITRNNLLEFYKKYVKGDKYLSIIGSVSEQDIFKIIKETLNVNPCIWQPTFLNLEKELIIPGIKIVSSNPIQIIKSPQIKQTLVFIGFKSIGIYSKWVHVISIISNILTGGMTSRLFVLLRNKLGLTYYQNSFNKTFNTHGLFCISYGVQPSGLELSLEHVLKEILNFSNSEILDDELKKAKSNMETSMLFNLETPSDLGSEIMNYVIDKQNPEEIKKIHKKISKLKTKHIQCFAKKMFTKPNLHIIINGPNNITSEQINKIIDNI